MGIFSKFEHHVEDGFDGMNDKLFDAPISPVQIAKKAEKQMRREKMVGAGKEFAPTLYTVLVNPDDDERLFGYYPTLAGETETYLRAKANESGLAMDGAPLVRFIVDEELRSGKFEVIAELVSAPIIDQLREEEMQRYGLFNAQQNNQFNNAPQAPNFVAPQPGYAPAPAPSPYNPVPAGPESGIDVMSSDQSLYGSSAVAEPIPQTVAFSQRNQQNFGKTPQLINFSTGRTFDMVSARILIGRAINCDIVLDDLNASRTHAELRLQGPSVWTVADLGSTNGTLVNGKHIAESALNDGDRITIGTTTFLFTYR